jgi:hypothetical protein
VTPDALLGGDRPARLQMIAALVLGLVLVAIPLYLWRRPRSEAVTVTSQGAGSASAIASGAPNAPAIGTGNGTGTGYGSGYGPGNGPGNGSPASDAVLLSEARVLECHDPGTHHTPATDCDHLAPIEKAFAQAIRDTAMCMPTAAGGGTLVFIADVSFQRKRNPIAITVPKDGRALRGLNTGGGGEHAVTSGAAAKIATGCGAEVKRALHGVPLDGVPHAHARYKVAITATYNPK